MGRTETAELTLDTSVLNARLQSNPTDVTALLFGKTTGNTGLFNSIHSAYSALSDSVTGAVQSALNGYATSIKTLNKSIADQTDRIAILKASLTRQYAAVDAAIGQMNGQGSALTGIVSALNGKNNG